MFAILDGLHQLSGFTPVSYNYNPLKSSPGHPGPWTCVPLNQSAVPSYDPATQVLVGPAYAVGANDVTETYTVRAMTPSELKAYKDGIINSVDLVAFTVLFNHENRIRPIEKPAQQTITKAQFIAALEALL